MNVLPRCNEAIIPIEKLTEYALNPSKQPHKALAFELALGYNQDNAEKLIANILMNLHRFPAKDKGDRGYGTLYEVVMELIGENGKSARVLLGWIDDVFTGEMRMVSIYVDKRKRGTTW